MLVVDLFDATGGRVGSPLDVVLPPGAARQVNRLAAAAGASGDLPSYSAFVSRKSGGDWLAYASRVDNRSGDPVYVPDGLAAKEAHLLPGLASAPGQNGTRWKSRLVVAQAPSFAADEFLEWLPASGATGGQAELQVPARGTVESGDALVDLFGATPPVAGTAAMNIDNPSVLWASTYNDSPAGTYGQTILAVDLGLGPLPPQRLVGVARSAAWRTNLGLVPHDAGTSPSRVRLTLLGADGETLSTGEVEVPAGTQWQGDLFAAVGAPSEDIAESTLVVEPIGDSPGSVLAWASRVDNRTGDPTFVPGRVTAESDRVGKR